MQQDSFETGAVCIANIGPRVQRKRLTSGLIGLALAVLVGLFLILMGWPWWTRLIVFVFFYLGFVGILQVRRKT